MITNQGNIYHIMETSSIRLTPKLRGILLANSSPTHSTGPKLLYDRVSDVVENGVSFASKILTHNRMH